jgi:hypothetical protein
VIARRSRTAAGLVTLLVVTGCGAPPASRPPGPADPAAPAPQAPAPAPVDPQLAEETAPVSATAARAQPATGLVPSNASGCAPGMRCLKVTRSGRPSNAGTSIAQCRGTFADFIVPKSTIPAGYTGPWFKPELVEAALTGVPQGARPWQNIDPRDVTQRLAYLLTLRNYAFVNPAVRSLTPALTADSDYLDPAGGMPPANQRTQKWYPAPRMIYGLPSDPGAREAAHGMTLERRVQINELGGNTAQFLNYAVAYYDARGARTYARVWSTATAGRDVPDVAAMRFTEGALVFKLIFGAARPPDFPTDLLAGSVPATILPNSDGSPVSVRLLQIDIAVKDSRAGPTGWYFATYAFDRSAPGASPWRKMVPLGLMWGNDPSGPPTAETWINASAPAYARAHLGVGGRLNGPVDNPVSACMSCHSTAQAPSLANLVPPFGNNTCSSQRSNWFRNLPGSQPFGRFDPQPSGCQTSTSGLTLAAADYSLQLSETVTAGLPSSPALFNPCTWDTDHPPAQKAVAERGPARSTPRVFTVTRDPPP